MNARKIVALVATSAALLLVGAGLAHADSASGDDDNTGYPSTQSDTQGADAGAATVGNMGDSFSDASNAEQGHARPQGADGTESRFGGPDPRFVEGPAGGLVKNGPLE